MTNISSGHIFLLIIFSVSVTCNFWKIYFREIWLLGVTFEENVYFLEMLDNGLGFQVVGHCLACCLHKRVRCRGLLQKLK